jgi:hypothetical protein
MCVGSTERPSARPLRPADNDPLWRFAPSPPSSGERSEKKKLRATFPLTPFLGRKGNKNSEKMGNFWRMGRRGQVVLHNSPSSGERKTVRQRGSFAYLVAGWFSKEKRETAFDFRYIILIALDN